MFPRNYKSKTLEKFTPYNDSYNNGIEITNLKVNNGEYTIDSTVDFTVDTDMTVNGEITVGNYNLFNIIYPVGSIYMSVNSTSPADLFKIGTWTQIKDNRFLLCSSTSKTTGGSSTISTSQLPKHNHKFSGENVVDALQFRRCNNPHNIVSTYGNNLVFTYLTTSGDTWNYGIPTNTYNPQQTDVITFNYTPSGSISSTGEDEEYWQPYFKVYCWYRTA